MRAVHCPLCQRTDETVLWRNAALRVIDASAEGHPGFTRVIWQAHVREMTDLSATERQHLMHAVWMVERAQRDTLAPDKINLASLGNKVAHLHWHIIPRWRDDRHFPEAVWAMLPEDKDAARAQAHTRHVQAHLADYHAALIQALQTGMP